MNFCIIDPIFVDINETHKRKYQVPKESDQNYIVHNS